MKTCRQVYLKGITIMITWLLLFSLVCKSTQDGNGQENGVLHCGPQNVTPKSSEQSILVTWEDEASCSALHDTLIYELLVLIADERVHYEEVAVMPEQIGSTHSWNWTSPLVLKCASVRLRSRYKHRTSPWKQEQTLPESANSEMIEVFPRDRVFEVGSRATFCCYVPAGQTFSRMVMSEYDDSNTTQVNNQTYIFTVHLNQASTGSGANVICETKKSSNGACAYIGYPPDDSHLQCETSNLQSVECEWRVGKDTHLFYPSPTDYQLLQSPCPNGSQGTCKIEMQVDAGERNWTLTAKNHLGKVELTDTADLTKRVHMLAPEGLADSTVYARNVTLEWGWSVPQYNNLNITCQVHVSHSKTYSISETSGVGLRFAVLDDLIPLWRYNAKVRCGTAQHFWRWSEWSTSIDFITMGDVPDALDVWRQVEGDHVIITWKEPLANQSHGHIIDYKVTYSDQQNTTTVLNETRLTLSLDTTEDYIITVTARNENGSSSPSVITIPSLSPESSDKTEKVNTSRILGSSGSFSLSWSPSPKASCGYTVDWCPTLGKCEVEWLKVLPNQTSATVSSKQLSDGVRYSLSVYACTQGAPVLLERREGYIREKRIENNLFKSAKYTQQDSDVVVSWDPINPREQSAFIQGYVLHAYCSDNDKKQVIPTNLPVSTEDLEATSLTVKNLNFGSCTFTLQAQTAVGECGTTPIHATLNSLTDNLVKSVVISLVTVFGLLSLITILCYRHWTCIKRKVYPPIPEPVLSDKWLTSLGENSRCPLAVDQCHHSEADFVDISELRYNPEASQNGYVCQENTLFVYTPTPQDYYNQPLKKHIPPPLTLPTAVLPPQSGLPSSPLRGVFPNPSYNLILQPEDQQSKSGPELQGETVLETSSGGYQPQSPPETHTVNQTTEDPGSPMFCVSTYILLPQLASK